MYTFKTFFVLTFVSYVIAAPPTDEPAECKLFLAKDEELSKCCNTEVVTRKDEAAVEECFKLAKDEDDGKGPLKLEGYEVKGRSIFVGARSTRGINTVSPHAEPCLDDCIMSKLGLMGADKKIDSAKVNAEAKSVFTGDWAELGVKMTEKCLAQAAGNKEKSECSSGADIYISCMFRESYINCPEKFWTSSDTCKTNKERLAKCPKALPYMG